MKQKGNCILKTIMKYYEKLLIDKLYMFEIYKYIYSPTIMIQTNKDKKNFNL